jgi:hypothetical protein
MASGGIFLRHLQFRVRDYDNRNIGVLLVVDSNLSWFTDSKMCLAELLCSSPLRRR